MHFCDSMHHMPHPDQTSFRFKEGQRQALEKIGKDNGDVDVSQLVRWAIEALIKHVERNGGRLLLPVDFSETFTVHTASESKGNPDLKKKAG